MTLNKSHIGYDVSKAQLDAFDAGRSSSLANSADAIAGFADSLADRNAFVVIEATGA